MLSPNIPTRMPMFGPHATWMDIWELVQMNEVRIDLMSLSLIHFRFLWGHLQPLYLDLLRDVASGPGV